MTLFNDIRERLLKASKVKHVRVFDGLNLISDTADTERLLEALDIAHKKLYKITYGPMDSADVQGEANEALIQLQQLSEKR